MTAAPHLAPVAFIPGLQAGDAVASYWLRQATVRLRREIAWLRHERGALPSNGAQELPLRLNPAQAALDLVRFHQARQQFYTDDPTGRYLSELLRDPPPVPETLSQGGFGWVANALDLDEVAAFTLALALLPVLDGAAGSVLAACLDDPAHREPTLALAQRLWEAPEALLPLADPAHPLRRTGLLTASAEASVTGWEQPLRILPLVAETLLWPDGPLPAVLSGEAPAPLAEFSPAVRFTGARLAASAGERLQVIPVCGPHGAAHEAVVQAAGTVAGRAVAHVQADPDLLRQMGFADALGTLAWLRGCALHLGPDLIVPLADDPHGLPRTVLPRPSIPAIVFVSVEERTALPPLPPACLLPALPVPILSYDERVARWKTTLGKQAKALDETIREVSRRFRFEAQWIEAVAAGLKGQRAVAASDLVEACRAAATLDLEDLAQRVTPRFAPDALMLPPKQAQQFEELAQAVQALTRVHYEWGTARVWNESGITALFAGPPGTGKTMAAEVLAARLDLPMFRIDLSQVVNKYIGETEKNLKRLFDAADRADTLLFFDEADALFGQRTEVKDAHDRYANLEVSYLLQRMERFKGVAILATNRKRDLDEAFLRRLRFVLDFPLPEATERRRIWQQVLPDAVNTTDLDLDFLAERFQLAGGHIRSIVLNACLQSAEADPPHLTMEAVVAAVKREYDKLGRSISLDHFGSYAALVAALDPPPLRR